MGLTVALESLLTNSATMVFRGGWNGHKRLATESEKYLIKNNAHRVYISELRDISVKCYLAVLHVKFLEFYHEDFHS